MLKILLMLLIATPSAASNEPVQLREGEPAPYQGILVPREVVLQAIKCWDVDVPLLKAEILREQHLLMVAAQRCERLVNAERKRGDALSKQLQETIKPTTPWYEHAAFWVPLSVAVASVTTYLLTRELGP